MNETKIIDQLQSQAAHILRFYEEEELEDKIIELGREWFYKGLKTGLEHQQKGEAKNG